jgi:hypothetical protein
LDVSPQVSTEGIESAGYRFIHTDEPGIGQETKFGTKDAIWNPIGVKVANWRISGLADIDKLAPRQTIAEVGQSL